jgi:hypothetical protein
MKTKTLVIAAVIIAATASLALAPTFTSTALAKQTTEVCIHNGNGEQVDCNDTHGKSSNEVTLCKERGRFVPCPE